VRVTGYRDGAQQGNDRRGYHALQECEAAAALRMQLAGAWQEMTGGHGGDKLKIRIWNWQC
jgi:hypothetical protein